MRNYHHTNRAFKQALQIQCETCGLQRHKQAAHIYLYATQCEPIALPPMAIRINSELILIFFFFVSWLFFAFFCCAPHSLWRPMTTGEDDDDDVVFFLLLPANDRSLLTIN